VKSAIWWRRRFEGGRRRMKSLTEHLWFETPHRRDYINIAGTVE
jgi:hypothetical protein